MTSTNSEIKDNQMKEPEQWAIKQHIEKNPKCEWICPHTNIPNLGEQPNES